MNCIHFLYCSRAAALVRWFRYQPRRLYNVQTMAFAQTVGLDRKHAQHQQWLSSHSRPYHHTWYSDEQRLNSTRVGLSVSKYPRFQVSFSLLVCCQHHNYLIHPLLKPSRQQWRPQLHPTTHIPQATIPHLCSVYLYSTQRQITPTTTHPILDSASPVAKMLSSQR